MITALIDKITAEIRNIKTKYDISLIPFEKLTLKSDRTVDAIESSIGYRLEWTETFGVMFLQKSLRLYEGWVKNGEFKFRRTSSSGRNSFIPIVSSKIYKESDKVSINAKIGFHPFVFLLLICIISFALFLFVSSITSSQYNETMLKLMSEIEQMRDSFGEERYQELVQLQEPSNNVVVSFLFVVAPYVISMIFFNIEARELKNHLREIVQRTDSIDEGTKDSLL